jgi:hypothetical protein
MTQKSAWIRSSAAFTAVLGLVGCEATVPGARAQDQEPTHPAEVTRAIDAACQASDQAFVRRAMLAVLGRRPWGQAEVDAVAAAIDAVKAQEGADDPKLARRVVVRALMQEPAFRERWADFFMDALRVARSGTKSLKACYGEPGSEPFDAGELARFVRDHSAADTDPPSPGFTMNELMRSALELDDVSVIYRAHLYAMLNRPLGGNATENEVELARRNDFGAVFEASYTNRNLECLVCHNSDFSVTSDDDPAANRFWPVPGSFERVLFGSRSGRHPPEEAAGSGSDLLRSRSMFRVAGVVHAAGAAPFGWDGSRCGTFERPSTDDPLGVDTYFGSVRGRRASVWELESSLTRGVEALAHHAAAASERANSDDPDAAFAYVVGLNVVERVWVETVGTDLTIAHHFPRTSVQREVLETLTDAFVGSRFSLKGLLLDIVTHPVFNLLPPSAGCETAYPLPRVFDAWTDAEALPEMRGNSIGDAVFPLSPRVLRKSLHRALGWPGYPAYPDPGTSEESLQLALGFALRDGEPGQRSLDFQGRLAWEATYGACAPLGSEDFVAILAKTAASTPGATVRDAFVALKDRLLGSSTVSETERVHVEALIGVSLDSPVSVDLEGKLRIACGVLSATPQFQLGTVVAPDGDGTPVLAPSEASREASCARLQDACLALELPYDLRCGH